jgi:hypothetical protein
MYPYNDMAFVFATLAILAKAMIHWFYHNNCIPGKVYSPPPYLSHKLYICPSSNKNNQR